MKRMPTIYELMPLAERPSADWISALLAFAPFALFIIIVLLV